MNIRILWRRLCLAIPFMRRFLGMPIVLYIIRHPESARNEKLAGRLHLPENEMEEKMDPDHDIGITKKGEEQARATADQFFDVFGALPDVIIHSGYVRTRRLAEILAVSFGRIKPGIAVREDVRIRERESGYTFTMSQKEVDAHFPFLKRYWPTFRGFFARPVGGESLADILEGRLALFSADMNRRYAGKSVALCTHGRIIQTFRCMLDEMSWDAMERFIAPASKNEPHNCSITIYCYDPVQGKLVLSGYNIVICPV